MASTLSWLRLQLGDPVYISDHLSGRGSAVLLAFWIVFFVIVYTYGLAIFEEAHLRQGICLFYCSSQANCIPDLTSHLCFLCSIGSIFCWSLVLKNSHGYWDSDILSMFVEMLFCPWKNDKVLTAFIFVTLGCLAPFTIMNKSLPDAPIMPEADIFSEHNLYEVSHDFHRAPLMHKEPSQHSSEMSKIDVYNDGGVKVAMDLEAISPEPGVSLASEGSEVLLPVHRDVIELDEVLTDIDKHRDDKVVAKRTKSRKTTKNPPKRKADLMRKVDKLKIVKEPSNTKSRDATFSGHDVSFKNKTAKKKKNSKRKARTTSPSSLIAAKVPIKQKGSKGDRRKGRPNSTSSSSAKRSRKHSANKSKKASRSYKLKSPTSMAGKEPKKQQVKGNNVSTKTNRKSSKSNVSKASNSTVKIKKLKSGKNQHKGKSSASIEKSSSVYPEIIKRDSDVIRNSKGQARERWLRTSKMIKPLNKRENKGVDVYPPSPLNTPTSTPTSGSPKVIWTPDSDSRFITGYSTILESPHVYSQQE